VSCFSICALDFFFSFLCHCRSPQMSLLRSLSILFFQVISFFPELFFFPPLSRFEGYLASFGTAFRFFFSSSPLTLYTQTPLTPPFVAPVFFIGPILSPGSSYPLRVPSQVRVLPVLVPGFFPFSYTCCSFASQGSFPTFPIIYFVF